MVESLKLFVRTYVYWVGLILGFAMVPGSLLFTAEVAPVNTPLWLASFAGLLLFIIDQPSTWEPPLWRALLIRVWSAGFAATMLIAFDAVASTHYGSQYWSETLLSFGLGWIVFTVVAGYMLMHSSARFGTPAHTIRDAIRTYTTWIGICFGIFYIPAAGLSAAGTLLMVLPLYGTFLAGLVLLIVDPATTMATTASEGTVDTTLSSVATQVGVVSVVRQIIGDGQTLKSAVILKPFSPDGEKGFACATITCAVKMRC